MEALAEYRIPPRQQAQIIAIVSNLCLIPSTIHLIELTTHVPSEAHLSTMYLAHYVERTAHDTDFC